MISYYLSKLRSYILHIHVLLRIILFALSSLASKHPSWRSYHGLLHKALQDGIISHCFNVLRAFLTL